MRRLILMCVLAVSAMAVVPALAGANHSGGQGPNYEKVNGTGENNFGLVHVNVKDQDGPRGHFFINGDQVQGEATCVNVQGNRTIIGGIDRRDGAAFNILIEDNQEPGSGRDRMAVRGPLPPPFDQNCNNPLAFAEFVSPVNVPPIARGNYIVHDQQP